MRLANFVLIYITILSHACFPQSPESESERASHRTLQRAMSIETPTTLKQERHRSRLLLDAALQAWAAGDRQMVQDILLQFADSPFPPHIGIDASFLPMFSAIDSGLADLVNKKLPQERISFERVVDDLILPAIKDQTCADYGVHSDLLTTILRRIYREANQSQRLRLDAALNSKQPRQIYEAFAEVLAEVTVAELSQTSTADRPESTRSDLSIDPTAQRTWARALALTNLEPIENEQERTRLLYEAVLQAIVAEDRQTLAGVLTHLGERPVSLAAEYRTLIDNFFNEMGSDTPAAIASTLPERRLSFADLAERLLPSLQGNDGQPSRDEDLGIHFDLLTTIVTSARRSVPAEAFELVKLSLASGNPSLTYYSLAAAFSENSTVALQRLTRESLLRYQDLERLRVEVLTYERSGADDVTKSVERLVPIMTRSANRLERVDPDNGVTYLLGSLLAFQFDDERGWQSLLEQAVAKSYWSMHRSPYPSHPAITTVVVDISPASVEQGIAWARMSVPLSEEICRSGVTHSPFALSIRHPIYNLLDHATARKEASQLPESSLRIATLVFLAGLRLVTGDPEPNLNSLFVGAFVSGPDAGLSYAKHYYVNQGYEFSKVEESRLQCFKLLRASRESKDVVNDFRAELIERGISPTTAEASFLRKNMQESGLNQNLVNELVQLALEQNEGSDPP